MKIVNLYAGPGTGKSTTAAALFAELKYRGHNTELVTEFAKDAAWENRGKKFFRAQEYILGEQSFRLSRVASEVEFVVTDSPILLTRVYREPSYLPALDDLALQVYQRYDNLDVFLVRSADKPFNPKGRNQTEDEAQELDTKIFEMLRGVGSDFATMAFNRDNVNHIIELMGERKWL